MATTTKRRRTEADKTEGKQADAQRSEAQQADAGRAAGRQTAAVATGPFALFAEGIRATYASQDAAQRVALDTFGRGQRLWWDSLRGMAQVSVATFAPVTARQLDERFETVERRTDELRQEVRAELERATTALGEAQQEASREQAQSVREVVRETAREQRAGRAALEETIAKLDTRLDRLAKAQAKQTEEVQAALTEHEQRLRDRLGDRIRTAVASIEAPKPADLEELRRQVAALAESLTATRNELATLARELRDERAGSRQTASAERPSSTPSAAGTRDRGAEASEPNAPNNR